MSETILSRQVGISTSLTASAINKFDAKLIAFIAFHIPLALLMRTSPTLTTIHAVITLSVCVFLAATKAPISKIVCAAGYVMGAETLWRMMFASIFWETGKYAVCLIFLLALFRSHPIKIPRAPIVYFILLLPAAVITLSVEDFAAARNDLSFNLSGPLALTICAIFFSNVKLSKADFTRLWLIVVGPMLGIASVVFDSTFLGRPIVWGENSNFQTTGGFGPNQVSSIIGLGALLLWFLMINRSTLTKMMLILLSGGFLALGVLTFSRGGVYTALAAGVVFIPNIFRGKHLAAKIIALILGVLLVVFVVFPKIDGLTNGGALTRFEDFTTNGRDLIVEGDLQLFLANPITGVGVGLSTHLRSELRGIVAHTEYTRLLADHGVLGIGAIILLALMIGQNFRRSWSNPFARNIIIVLTIWALITMSLAAMRLVAAPFILGLTFCTFTENENNPSRSLGQTK